MKSECPARAISAGPDIPAAAAFVIEKAMLRVKPDTHGEKVLAAL